MLPFLLDVAALVALVVFLRSPLGRARRRGALATLGIAVATSVLGVVPFLGIPGAVVYQLAAPCVRVLLGAGYDDLGDGAWPAAIILTLTWPASLVLAYTVAYGPLHDGPPWMRWGALVLIPYAAAVALALWAHLSSRGS